MENNGSIPRGYKARIWYNISQYLYIVFREKRLSNRAIKNFRQADSDSAIAKARGPELNASLRVDWEK
jgi:hypothetical protein